jgi:VCBS repeat-containing protein
VRGDNFVTGVLEVDGTPSPLLASDADADTRQSRLQIPTDPDGDYDSFVFAADGTWSNPINQDFAEPHAGGQTAFETREMTSLEGSASAAIPGAADVPEASPEPLAAITLIGVSDQSAATGEYFL